MRPHPTLVIGLGGTGQWVACHVLKELLELYNLQDPADLSGRVQILAIDTDFSNQARVGFGRRNPQGGVLVGEVKIPDQMRAPVGAAVHGYVQSVASGLYPETGSWFDAKWFLAQPGSDALLNLVNGAGQFRPLGRLAVPYNLVQGAGTVRNAITSAIRTIQSQMDSTVDKNLIVCITGSLCGGTGAGMVVDVAHLVRQIASVPVSIRGYLVLPNAFEGTVPQPPDGGTGFRLRAFAAMRELRRFAREIDYEVGYPMYYSGPERADGVLRGKITKSLFEQLYYFDAGLTRPERQKSPVGQVTEREVLAPVKNGIAPLIAEAILLWVDEQTAGEFLSHAANLAAQKVTKVSAGNLDPRAAVTGGMGVYALQLPLYYFVEEWAHNLGRAVLRQFIGVPVEGGEDATTKRAINLLEDRAGGVASATGSQAAQEDWKRTGQVGGKLLSELHKDQLKTGAESRAGGATQLKRDAELRARTAAEWEQILAPVGGPVEEDENLVAEFLHPQARTVEERVILGRIRRPITQSFAQVTISNRLRGDTKKDESRRPALGAQRVRDEAETYLSTHLGPIGSGGRGGKDVDPEGKYPRMMRRWADDQVKQWREALQDWLRIALNNSSDPAPTAGEQASNAVQNRAARLGYSLALVRELTEMLATCEGTLLKIEQDAKGTAGERRDAPDLKTLEGEMAKATHVQERYLEKQQDVLLAERRYAAVRQARWACQQMLIFTREAYDSLVRWRRVLAEELYVAVWEGQDQIQTNLALMSELGAVRQVIDLPELKAARFKYYTEEDGRNASGEVLNDLRWQVEVRDEFDKGSGTYRPKLNVGLGLAGNAFSVDGGQATARVFLNRCRMVFADAWRFETLLGWLRTYYDNSSTERSLDSLVSHLQTRGRLSLRCQPGAAPYSFAYVRAAWKDDPERTWLHGLLTNLAQKAGADTAHSQEVASSDRYRLTLLLFHELIDVESLTAWVEATQGMAGAGSYFQLRARSDSTALSRQVLHVLAAERNTAIYEEQLGRLLPDRLVALMEDRERFRLFVRAWAYGQAADGAEILFNTVRLPDNHPVYPGKWVRRLTTGPFDGDLDPLSQLPLPAQQRWLTPPGDDPSLVVAAETFLLRGIDKWQTPGESLPIGYERVERHIAARRLALSTGIERGNASASLWTTVDEITDAEQKKRLLLSMAEYEHLQRRTVFLSNTVIPDREKKVRSWRAATGGAYASQAEREQAAVEAGHLAETELDVELLRVMQLFIAEELRQIKRDVLERKSGDQSAVIRY